MVMARGIVLTLLMLSLAILLSGVSVSAHATNSAEAHVGRAPFGFIEKLGGRHKGEKNVTDLRKLKAYLNRFGYPCSDDHSHDDEFDTSLEAAIKAYQMNYRLTPTGVLDKETVEKMMAPRCGYPDTVNRTVQLATGMMMKKQSGSLRTVSHYNFFPNQPRWPLSKTNLRYTFFSNLPDYARQPIANAFGQWEAATRFTFEYVTAVNQADLTIGFYSGEHGDRNAFDGPGGILAHAFAPTNGRMHFDETENWSTDPTPGAMHLETVAVHEIGHLLGLDHSQVEEAIMYATIAPGVSKVLQPDDKDGIRVLYS
uniref:Peptidase metallopeptidase domain-containing protein n=1 Tax=Kalanchoe fedtschenkoi TaxID=63787 RepID=A0A7N0T8M2_KALFE